MDSHALAWPSSWGYGLPRFGVAPRVGDMDSHALAWPSSWGYGLPCFGVALESRIWTPMLWRGPRVEDMDSHALAWPLELGIWTLALHVSHFSAFF